jgi:hypothetical protein
MEDQKLREFQVKHVTFYDGTGHRLGPSECALTSTRLIISDVEGGIHQLLLRNISGISMPPRSAAPKMLRISIPGQAYDIDCNTKDQTNAVAYWLGEAIRGSLAPESDSGPIAGAESAGSQTRIPRITSHRRTRLNIVILLF